MDDDVHARVLDEKARHDVVQCKLDHADQARHPNLPGEPPRLATDVGCSRLDFINDGTMYGLTVLAELSFAVWLATKGANLRQESSPPLVPSQSAS